MHVLRMYVYIDAPIVMGVLYMYVCMHVCMHYACMYVCMYAMRRAIRRADRYSARWVVLMCPKLNMHVL